MDLLAKRYPHYAEKIKDTVSEDSFPIRTPRPRDERRRTAVVTYNPSLNRSVEYDENGTMSDIDTASAGNFQRGHQLRSSLPIVRASSSTFERPLGLVFLVYKDETKKAALPNEVTTLDTVRALFVRSFSDKLTMQFMESPKNKIYIVDPRTNIYYQLEDLRDIKDRTVLKVHECDSDQPQVVKQRPEVRGKTIVPPAQNRILPANMPANENPQHSTGKSKSLPPPNSAAYQQMLSDNQSSRMTERPRSTTPTMDARGQAGIIPRQVTARRYSPERQATPDRPPLLGTIPENRQLLHGRAPQNGYTIPPEINPIPPYNAGYWPVDHTYQHPGFQRGYPNPSACPANQMYAPPLAEQGVNYAHYQGNSTAQPPLVPPQNYMVKSPRTPSSMTPQRSAQLLNPVDTRDGSKVIPPNRHSLTFAPMTPIPGVMPLESTPVNPMQRSQSYRVSTEREPIVEQVRSLTPQPGQDSETKVRMERMEAQLANLTAWVHNTVIPSRQHDSSNRSSTDMHSNSSTVSDSTYTGSAASSLSDIPSAAQHAYQGMAPSQKAQSPMYSTTNSSSNPNQPPVFGPNTRTRMILIKRRLDELKADFKNMQLLHQKNTEAGQAMFMDSAKKILSVLDRVSFTVSIQPVRKQRHDVDVEYNNFMWEEQRIDNALTKLENSVEEVRTDVISKQCRVNSTDVEKMALTLSQLSKCIAEQKNRFPSLTEKMKSIMSAEMEIVVQEEKFFKEQPERLDTALRRCKKLTGTLFTLKRLALVQERSPSLTPAKTTPRVLTTALHQSPSPLWPSHRQEAVASSDQCKQEQASTGQLAPGLEQHIQATHKLLPTNGMPPNGDSGNAGGGGDETSLSNSTSDSTAKEPGERMTPLPISAEVRSVEKGELKKKALPQQNTNILSFTSTPNVTGHTQNIITKPIAKKADITKSLPSNHNFVMSAKKVTGSTEKSYTPSVLSPVCVTKNNTAANVDNKPDNTKASLIALASNKNLARADFFSNMAPSQGYQVINSTQRSTPTTTLDYTVRISPVRTSLFTNTTSTTSLGSIRKPMMSTAVAVAEIRPKQPPPTPKKPSHLWKGSENSNTPSAILNYTVSEPTIPQTPTAFSPIYSQSSSSNQTQSSLSKFPLSSSALEETGGNKTQNSETSISTKKVPPPPPPRKSSKHPGFTAVSPAGSPVTSKGQKSPGGKRDATVNALKNGSPQFVQYTMTTHQSKPSMLHLQKNSGAASLAPVTPLLIATSVQLDNSPSKESADSTESFSSGGSQQSVIHRDVSVKQNGVNNSKKGRPNPPQRTTSQLTDCVTVASVTPLGKNSAKIVNGIKNTSSHKAKGDHVQETDID